MIRHFRPRLRRFGYFPPGPLVAETLILVGQELKAIFSLGSAHGKLKVFGLDFHASIAEELKMGFQDRGVFFLSWVISFHASNFRNGFLRGAPVMHLNERNWRRVDEAKAKFQRRYAAMLRSFDGFVVSYPTSYIRLYLETEKPILVVNPIRYEHPLTYQEENWKTLDGQLRLGIERGQVLFSSNNRADQAYASHFLGCEISYCPSLCDYVEARWDPRSTIRAVYDRKSDYGSWLIGNGKGELISLSNAVGAKYSWKQIAKLREVVVIPYAPSTMFMFELATMGVPVAVPSRSLLRNLLQDFPGVMSECTFNLMDDKKLPSNRVFEGTDLQRGPEMLEWWLDRSDFFDNQLMPNVRTFDSLEDLLTSPSMPERVGLDNYLRICLARNEKVERARDELLNNFLNRIRPGGSKPQPNLLCRGLSSHSSGRRTGVRGQRSQS